MVVISLERYHSLGRKQERARITDTHTGVPVDCPADLVDMHVGLIVGGLPAGTAHEIDDRWAA